MVVGSAILLGGEGLWLYANFTGENVSMLFNLLGLAILFGAGVVVFGSKNMSQALDAIEGMREITSDFRQASENIRESKK